MFLLKKSNGSSTMPVSEIKLPPVISNAISNFKRALSFQAGQESFFGQVERWYLIEIPIAYIHGDAQHGKDGFLRTFFPRG
jgi:hypothetical protein